jgi:RNA polymerase sigma-70 factor (ECF subfamily)
MRAMPKPAPHLSSDTDDHLLDPESLGEHLERLNAVAIALCGSRHEAEDLVQDALLKVLRRPRRVRGDDLTYLKTTVRNTFLSNRRSKLARPVTVAMPESLDGFAAAVSPGVESAVFARDVLAAVAKLPAPLRDALVSVHVAGFNCRDTAARLGVREGTIMSRCFRARARLAPMLEAA